MKRILALVLVSMFVWSSVAVAASKVETVTLTGVIKKNPWTNEPGSYVLDGEWAGWIYAADLKKTTKEFRKCVDNLKYKGTVTIKAKSPIADGDGLILDKTSTCKRR